MSEPHMGEMWDSDDTTRAKTFSGYETADMFRVAADWMTSEGACVYAAMYFCGEWNTLVVYYKAKGE